MARLHNDYKNHQENEHIICDIDLDIKKYINQNNTKYYDHIIKYDDRWEVFYHLSEMRCSLLNWYEFRENSEILQINGGFGAITGMLCERGTHVTTTESSVFRAKTLYSRWKSYDNLDVYIGEFEDIVFDRKFDYIVLIGILETQGDGTSQKKIYADYLHKTFQLLKPDGKLLLATENRYGIRYFCGAQDPHTGKAFDGINHYPTGTKGYSFSKQEIIDILDMAGFEFHKFYYPLPDYKLPQLIYSENYLPQKNIRERLIPYYHNKNTLVAYENDLYDDLVDNNVFEFFSNSFFVECSSDNNFCSVNYATLSIDRGKKNGFATTIHNNNTVKKKALYKEGEKNLFKLYKNMMDLKNKGINIVCHNLEKNEIKMPYIEDMTLSNYLKKIIKTDKEEFINIFDRLYNCILSSSEHVVPEDNALCNNKTRDLNWGVILRKAYIELIPLNSFYINRKIVFFDQEFVRENYPAKYILFRALLHTYCFAPYTERVIPLKMMKQRYELDEVWDIFIDEENRFISEIRNHEQYSNFYKWARIDKSRIHKNVQLLESEGEIIADYKVSKKMKDIWAVQLNLLQVFVDVCQKNDLTYYIIYGTLLGAVRHKGFIPWDDDIDVAMPRKDYEKLKEISPTKFNEPYFFQTPENDQNCFYNGYSRLRNVDTTGISLIDIGHDGNHGIWIDIMPLDSCPSYVKRKNKKIKRIRLVQRLLYAKIYQKEYDHFLDMTKFQWKLYGFITKFIKHKLLCYLLNRTIIACKEKDSIYIGIFTHYNHCQIFDKRDFESTVLLDFENLKLTAPEGYKRCLKMSIGDNYMKYPPVENRKPSHRGIFNTEYSYKRYTKLFSNLFSDCKDKNIVIFGAGLMFENYMKKYSKKYSPVFIVDNDEGKWGTKRHGIDIKSPNEILKTPQEKLKIIICSVYYREIEKQLKHMGITDYKIYTQEKEWIVRNEENGK